jgi:DNA cross-link repair 1A protein
MPKGKRTSALHLVVSKDPPVTQTSVCALNSSLTKNYFLTHFHSDHYGGITAQWNAGIIYCSLETANLVHQQLGVDRKYLHPLGMLTQTIIESHGKPVSVTLIDANHCPGAVMFLFEVGKRRILHVGDFRWDRDLMMKCAPLRAFSTMQVRLDDLFLDTTYCDERYTLPTQAEAIRATIEIAEKEWERSKRRGQRALFLFGAYTIGKERIYLSVAERLQIKVFVDKSRFRILSALNWPRERMSLLTTNPEDSCLWVVPLGHINFKKMQSYLGGLSDKVFSKTKYDRVVGFRPTGWSVSACSNGIVSTKTKGRFTVHGIPYSEHSSFTELVECLECLKPKRIIPTVSVSRSAEQVDLLLRKVKENKQGH